MKRGNKIFLFHLDAPSLEGLTRHLSGGKFQPGWLIFI
jgi:hypothetical protein